MKKASLICTLLLFFTAALANNVQVNTVSYNSSAQTVTFTLSWENSWDLPTGSPPSNHDAVWVFIKCKTGGDTWSHALLSTTASAHTAGSGLTLAQPLALNQYGVLIKRSTQGFGDINTNNTVSLQLTAPANITAIQVFAVEMVYIPEGSFGVGRTVFNTTGKTLTAFTITSENAIPALTLGNYPESPAPFPKGFNAFYVMKYEISQGQYTDFLNTLTRSQQQERVAADISGTTVTNLYVMSDQAVLTSYNHIMCGASIPAAGSVSFNCAVPEKACNYLSATDLISYLDWAGLRPFTELEFEKICRGFDPREDGQYIWSADPSATFITQVTVIDPDLPSETTSGADPDVNTQFQGNIARNNPNSGYQLMRCGFSGSKPINRALSGASYFGVMEMAGNVGELIVNLYYTGFTGINGNGDVADIPADWPGNNAGLMPRGGCYTTAIADEFMIQTRYFGNGQTVGANNERTHCFGGRGALSL